MLSATRGRLLSFLRGLVEPPLLFRDPLPFLTAASLSEETESPLLVRRMMFEPQLLVRLPFDVFVSSSSGAVPGGIHNAGFRVLMSRTQASQSDWTQKSMMSLQTLSGGLVKFTKTTLPPLL